jgi:hypothetical protein
MTDSLGCTAIDNITINEPPQLLAIVTILSEPSGPEACDAELSYSANGGTIPYTAQWVDCANDTVIWWPIMPPPPWYFCAGEWGITILDAHGCSATSCVTVIDPPTSTQELDDQIELTYQIMDRSVIFSEPINELRIFDALGHLVFTSSSGSVTQVTLPDIPTGLYILAASTNNNLKLTSKLIIQR